MKRRYLVAFTGFLMLLIVAVVYAAAAGYTYYIPSGSSTSVYNIWGDTEPFPGYPPPTLGNIRARTYSVRISGTPVPSFDSLKLRGRVWRKFGGTCPLVLTKNLPGNCPDCLATQPLWIPFPETLSNYESTWFSVSRHKLTHSGATKPSGGTPGPFFTELIDAYPHATPDVDNFRGEGIYCSSNLDAPLDDD